MDYVSIVELAEKAGVSGNTVILYLSMFEDFFATHRIVDGKKTYPPEKTEIIRAIHQLYQRQRFTKQEIRERLVEMFPEAQGSAARSDPVRNLEKTVAELTREIRRFNEEGLPGLVRAVSDISGRLACLATPSGDNRATP